MTTRHLLGIAAFAGFLYLGFATPCRADSCFGGGNNYKQDASTDKLGLLDEGIGTRRKVGGGLLAAAAVGAVWLSARRRLG
jgi:hypothetical protein